MTRSPAVIGSADFASTHLGYTFWFASAENLAAAHWDRFIYRRLARTWHAIWCRWSPAGERRSKWHAERCFAPLPCEQRDGSDDGCDMRVVYHYDDSRGTVRDDEAKCGCLLYTSPSPRDS